MIAARLRLRPAAIGPADAWLIPGSDPAVWLAGCQRLGIDMDGAMAVILPIARNDPTPAAMLVLATSASACAGEGALPWRLRDGRLAFPSDAEPWPPLADSELGGLLGHDLTVLHPGIGRLGYSTGDLCGLASLLTPPPRLRRRWHAAEAPPAPRLAAVEPVLALDPDLVMRLARDDIGEHPIGELPDDGQDAGPLATAAAQVRAALARLVLGVHGLLPRGAGPETWADRMAQWAQRSLTGATASIEAARNRELARLLRLLAEDLDRGLRFALPIGGDDDHRGVASPGTRLPSRALDFDLRGLRGGRRVDRWGMPADMRQTLAQRYRQAAQRELALGRHRRAAYILAHLLGDRAGAARALEQGSHWREAAALWRDHLKQPREAAACLERGRLWAEAALVWRELREPEREAECLEHAGDRTGALAVWRRVVAACIDRDDLLQAAELSIQRLAEPDAGLALLARTWPAHRQAAGGLRARLDLLGRLGRHREAAALCALVADAVPEHILEPVAATLADATTAYPDLGVRADVADALRMICGSHLAAGHPAATAALAALPRSACEDRLLARDVARWQRVGPAKSRSAPRRLQLDPAVAWQQAASVGCCLVAIGFTEDRLRMVRLDLDSGATQHVTWDEAIPAGMLAFFLVERSDHIIAFLQCDAGDQRLVAVPIKNLPGIDAFPQPMSAGTHGPLQPKLRLAGPGRDGGWWLLSETGSGYLLHFAPSRGQAPAVRHHQPDPRCRRAPVPARENGRARRIGKGLRRNSTEDQGDSRQAQHPDGGEHRTCPRAGQGDRDRAVDISQVVQGRGRDPRRCL